VGLALVLEQPHEGQQPSGIVGEAAVMEEPLKAQFNSGAVVSEGGSGLVVLAKAHHGQGFHRSNNRLEVFNVVNLGLQGF